MRLQAVRIENYRCISDLVLELDDVTVLVGANGTGKSSALHAIGWFFEGGDLDCDDLPGQDESRTVTVSATFGEFTTADRDALGRYLIAEQATFTRRWSATDGEKLTGRGLALPAFERVRAHERAGERIAAYRQLRDADAALELPSVRSAQAADEAMAEWETEHPELLETATISATHLFGFAGQARLAGRYDFVLVPAVSDPEAETRDGRGTLLRQLLDRAIGEQASMRERLRALEQDVSERMYTIVREEGEEALRTLSERVTHELVQLVPGASVSLAARPPAFQVPLVGVDLHVADSGISTNVARQGHGFQRALLIALVQQLAVMQSSPDDDHGDDHDGHHEDDHDHDDDDDGDDARDRVQPDPAGLFLAIEEPELYQHPLQARHFAATLAGLPRSGTGTLQIAYATHSEHFVDPARYGRLRRFRKHSAALGWPCAEVRRATVERVAERLDGIVPAEQVETRVRITLRRALGEAVFAKAAVIVEGHTDVGLLRGLADRRDGFDAVGIAVVNGQGKRQLLIPWAILTELDVPTYVVFDGDARLAERLRAEGKPEQRVAAAEHAARTENALVLAALGADAREDPPTTVTDSYAVFEDTLETELALWDDFSQGVERVISELGDFRTKSEDAYRRAAAEAPTQPPQTLTDLLDAILAAAR
jgi:hypothetical protein